ncbi:unnamed protein product [Durusdinium trenchii]
MIEVSGSSAFAAYPALSPRSGMMKRKDGDHLGINGVYALRERSHNGAPCWVQVQPPSGSTEVWHIFRAADGLSWVIDSELHEADPDTPVAARLHSDAPVDPSSAEGPWVPISALRLRPFS